MSFRITDSLAKLNGEEQKAVKTRVVNRKVSDSMQTASMTEPKQFLIY